ARAAGNAEAGPAAFTAPARALSRGGDRSDHPRRIPLIISAFPWRLSQWEDSESERSGALGRRGHFPPLHHEGEDLPCRTRLALRSRSSHASPPSRSSWPAGIRRKERAVRAALEPRAALVKAARTPRARAARR